MLLLPILAKAQPDFLKINPASKVPEHGLVLQVGAGMSAINSDICRTPDCNRMRPGISLGALYKFTPTLAFSTELAYLRLGATEDNPLRPLDASFMSDVIALSGSVVVNLQDSYSGSGNYRSVRKRFIVPFVSLGAGVVYYTATSYKGQGKLNNAPETYEPAKNYPAFALIVPVGGGLRFRFSDKLSIAPMLSYYISSTDYLDNMGANSNINDSQVSVIDPYTTDHFGVAAIKVLYTPPFKNRIFSKFK